jgi:phage/plasmid-associated DNA primase
MILNNKNKKRKIKGTGQEEVKVKPWGAISVTLVDTVNIEKLKHASFLRLDPQVESSIRTFYKDRLKIPGEKKHVSYAPKKWNLMGREYPVGGMAIPYMPGFVRRYICGNLYHDIDFDNCGPTLFLYICKTTLKVSPPVLTKYVNKRDEIIQDIIRSHHLSREQIKKMFLAILQGGKHDSQNNLVKGKINRDTFRPVPIMVALEKELIELLSQLRVHPTYKELYKKIKGCPDKENKNGSFLSVIWQQVERKCLNFLREFFVGEGYNVGVLLYDGLFVDRTSIGYDQKLDVSLLRKAEQYIFEKTFGIHIGISEKSMRPTQDDKKKWYGEIVYDRIHDLFERAQYIMAFEGYKRKAKRMTSFVMVPHEYIPGVYVQSEEYDDFINKSLLHHSSTSVIQRSKLYEWFLHTDNPIFELLSEDKMSRNIISFRDGCYNLETLVFTKWTEVKKEDIPITDHFFDKNFPANLDEPTPLWDNLVKTQLGDDNEDVNGSMYDIFEVLIGRLFYNVGKYDRWQVHIFLKGDANTGKSTICSLITLMFPHHQVGVLGKEHKFGLESLWNKRVIITPDLPADLPNFLGKTDFQSMASGEAVNVARKNKTAKLVNEWTVPLLCAANFYIQYPDNGGSVSRRLAILMWNKYIKVRDTDLDKKIIDRELVLVMLRCLKKYRNKCQERKGEEFSRIIPETLKKDMEGTREKTNPMADFIENGSDRVQVVYEEGSITTKRDLQKAYTQFMFQKYKGQPSKIPDDYHIIKSKNMVPVISQICKVCEKVASSSTCGLHYNKGNNRRRRESFKNMKLIYRQKTREEEDEENKQRRYNNYQRNF